MLGLQTVRGQSPVFAPKTGAELASAPNIAGPGPAAAESPPKEKLPVPARHTENKVFRPSHLSNLPCQNHMSARLLTSHVAGEMSAP